MKRRVFIKTGFGVLGTAIVGLAIPDFKTVARKMILEDTTKLKIKKGFVDQFIEEAERERFWEEFSFPRKVLISFQYSLLPIGIKLPHYNKYRESRNQITGQFLLSTNLFFNADWPEKEIQYLGFHNPYKYPCSNPFSSHHSNSKFMISNIG